MKTKSPKFSFTRGCTDHTFEVKLKTFRVTSMPGANCVAENGYAAVSGPDCALALAHTIWRESLNCHCESVLTIAVNARNEPIALASITGNVDHSVFYPRSVLELCIRAGASGFLLFHNHPSGDLTPSTQDMSLTTNLKMAAVAMGIRFLDHMIISLTNPTEHFSFQQSGFL